MKTIAQRFDHARKVKGLTHKDLAIDFNITPAAISAAIKRNNIKPYYLTTFADKYQISYDWLLSGDGEMLTKVILRVEEPTQHYKERLVNLGRANVFEVPLVHRYAYAGYLTGYADTQYMDSLPTEVFQVDHNGHGNYLAFEINGDSMDDSTNNGYRSGDIALCREVQRQHWQDKLHINKWDFVIVHKTEGILLKRITKQENGSITLHSLNNLFEDFTVNLDDVAQLFNVIQTKQNRRR